MIFFKWPHAWLSWCLIWCYNCVCWFFPLWCQFLVFFTYGITRGCASGVSTFIVPIFIFDYFPFSWCNCRIFALLDFLIVIFYGFNCWSSSGYASTIGTLVGPALVNGCLDWYECLIWVYSWFTSWIFSWYAPLTGTLRGIAGEVDFPNIYASDPNASLCAFTVTGGLAGSGLFSAWIKYCAEWIVASVEEIFGMLILGGGGDYTVSEIRSALVLGIHALCNM